MISPTSLEITKVSYSLRFFNKTRALVLFLGLDFNIYTNFKSHKNSVLNLFIDSGAGLIISMVHFKYIAPGIISKTSL